MSYSIISIFSLPLLCVLFDVTLADCQINISIPMLFIGFQLTMVMTGSRTMEILTDFCNIADSIQESDPHYETSWIRIQEIKTQKYNRLQ